jgi:DNA-binding NarL/FixJ family response regulator
MIRVAHDEELGIADGLTPRESCVAFWLAQGKTNREIGLILTMQSRTVEKHVEHILTKLGTENRVAAALHLARRPDDRAS